MPRRSEIKNNIGTDLYSMQIYDDVYYENFNPNNTFEKWAAIEVSDFENVPSEMSVITLPAGLYAVFDYVGDQSSASSFFEYIFTKWLPNSEFSLDNRPRFEVLGEKYKNDDPYSEKEIWIPVKAK